MNVRIPTGNIAEHNEQMLEREKLAKSHIKKKKTKRCPIKVAIYSRYGRNFKMKNKNVVLYCRVASITQNSDILDIQEAALRKYAESNNYEVIEVIRETGSGTSLNRPGINKIYEIIDKYNVDAIIAKNMSRLGRCSHSELSNFIDSLEEKGVQVITMNEGNLTNIPFLKVAY